jgi:hypothetical protein
MTKFVAPDAETATAKAAIAPRRAQVVEFVFISVAERSATAAFESAVAGYGRVVEGPKIEARDTIPDHVNNKAASTFSNSAGYGSARMGCVHRRIGSYLGYHY